MALRVLSHQKEKPTSDDGLVVDSSLYLAAPTWADRWQDGYDNEGCFACIGRGIGRMTALALPPAIGCRGRVVLQRPAPPCPPVEGSRFGPATKGHTERHTGVRWQPQTSVHWGIGGIGGGSLNRDGPPPSSGPVFAPA
jgi:hypothetical protein